jgi:hypothetical protein
MKAWYVNAYDVAGGIHSTEGPMSWSVAQSRVAYFATIEEVSRTTIDEGPRSRGKRTDLCECGNAKRTPRAESCDICKRIDDERYAAGHRDTLTNEVRNLLRRHWPDWLDGAEVRAVTNDEESSAALYKLRTRGEIESRRIPAFGVVYRTRRAA